MRYAWLIGFGLLMMAGYGQDSSQLLRPSQLLKMVLQHHPEARQAYLQVKASEAKLRAARGGFDPSLSADYVQKDFKGTNYYSHVNAKLEVPTITGIKLKSGYELNEGHFLNPELNVPDDGLWMLGAELPIGQGLWTDAKRTKLRQAEVKVEMAENKNEIALNDLSMQALEKYWQWTVRYQQVQIYEEAFRLAQERLEFVKQSVENGDMAPIDSIEARIQVQSIATNLMDQRAQLQNAQLSLLNFIWQQNEPKRPEDFNFQPNYTQAFSQHSLDSLLQLLDQQHPLLRHNLLKQDYLDREKRWQAEQMKPTLNLEYSLLAGWEDTWSETIGGTKFSNHKVGLTFRFPLLMRESRGNWQAVKIEMESTELAFAQKENELKNKLRALYTEVQQLQDQVKMYEKLQGNYQILLAGEQEKFRNGESSMFLVNSRQQKLIEVQLKTSDLLGKLKIKEAQLLWITGRLHRQYI